MEAASDGDLHFPGAAAYGNSRAARELRSSGAVEVFLLFVCHLIGTGPPLYPHLITLRFWGSICRFCFRQNSRAAFRGHVILCDLELELADRTDIFYDMFHLNAVGGEAVARSWIACGFAARLQTAVKAVEAHDKAK
jgi:hypothetical protein